MLLFQINATSKRDISLMDISDIFGGKENFNFPMHADELEYVRKIL